MLDAISSDNQDDCVVQINTSYEGSLSEPCYTRLETKSQHIDQ